MKIKKEHYNILKRSMIDVMREHPDAIGEYIEQHNFKRFCFDVYWVVVKNARYYDDQGHTALVSDICPDLSYLQDSHRETAISKIVREHYPEKSKLFKYANLIEQRS